MMLVWTLSLAMVAMLLVGLALLTWRFTALQHEISKLSQECVRLRDVQDDQRHDLRGLASAGVQLDRRILDQNAQIHELQQRVDCLQAQHQAAQPYHAAIERIRNGAKTEDLVTELGLSFSEASLLTRLHGNGRGE